MVVLKLILDIMKKFRKFRGSLAIKNRATRPQFETYARYSVVDDVEQKMVLAQLVF